MAKKKVNVRFDYGYSSIPVVAKDGSIWIDHSDGLFRIEGGEAKMVPLPEENMGHAASGGINERTLRYAFPPPAVIKDRVIVLKHSRIQKEYLVCIFSDKGELSKTAPMPINSYNWLLTTQEAVFALNEYEVMVLDIDGSLKHTHKFKRESNMFTTFTTCAASKDYIIIARVEDIENPEYPTRIMAVGEDGTVYKGTENLHYVLYRMFEDGRIEKIWTFARHAYHMMMGVKILISSNKNEMRIAYEVVEREKDVMGYDGLETLSYNEDNTIKSEDSPVVGCGMTMMIFSEDESGKMQLKKTLKYGEWDNGVMHPIGPTINGKLGFSSCWKVGQYGDKILAVDEFTLTTLYSWWTPEEPGYDPNIRTMYSRLWIVTVGNEENPQCITIPEPFSTPSTPPILLENGKIMMADGRGMVATYFEGEWTMKKSPYIEYWIPYGDKAIAFKHENKGRLWEI